jgi:gustatory receptor
MNKNISDDFLLAIRPPVYVSRALGLAPFAYVKKTLPEGRKWEQLEISSPALLYSFFVVVLYLCFILSSIILKKNFVFTHLAESDVASDMLLHTASIGSLVSLALSVTTNRNTIVRIMYMIAKIDLIILKSSGEYYKKAKISLTVQLFVIFLILGFTFTYGSITWGSAYGYKVLFYSHLYADTLIDWIVVIQFMNMVILLKDRFSLLNAHLSILLGISEIDNSMEGFCLPSLKSSINVKEFKPQLTQKDVLTFNSIHDTMLDAVLLVKSTYEVQILFSLLSTFVGTIIWPYFGLCFFYGYTDAGKNGISALDVVLCDMIWSFLHIAKLFFITVPCHLANNNMAHTSTVLRKLLLAFHIDPVTMSELERFSYHVALRKFKFTVFGFLSLDLSLLFSMMGAVTTYLVILMQFKLSSNVSPACSQNMTA